MSEVKKHILAVDDTPSNLKFIEQLMEDRYQLTFALSGEQALKFAEKESFDLILLDSNMTGMDGLLTFEKIKELPGFSDVPVLFLTSSGDTGAEIKCIEMGAADIICKPFTDEIMLNRIETQLELSFLRKEYSKGG